jgi:DNA-directed RNA polymerase subunit alpha
VIEKNWQELIRPMKPEIQAGHDASRQAKIVAEPLERGFGMTLGNALRRVLLSSLQGAAVTAVQIDGVVHEFSSIPGVREDVTDIVLNIKQIALRMHAEGPKRLVLKKTGPGVVTAGDIEETADIEVINKDHVICTLDEGASVRFCSRSTPARAMSRPSATVLRTRPSATSPSTRSTARSSAWPTAWRTPAKARCWTMTS